MPTVYFGPWTPDAAELNSGTLVTAQNVLVAGGAPRLHYEPLQSLSAYSAGALDNPALGGAGVRLTNGTTAIYAGDSGKLYKLASDLTWTDQSKPGGYGVTSGEYWWFVLWNDQLIAGTGAVPPQVVDVDSGAQFADLAGSPPQARYATVIGPHLFLAGLNTAPKDVRWSAAGDETAWTTGGGSNGGTQSFREGGWIRGVTGGRFAGYVFQEELIRRVVYTQDDAHFQFDVVIRDIGLTAPWSLATIGGTHFFLSHDGFYAFNGQETRPIGRGRIDRTFLDDADPAFFEYTIATIDPNDTKVYWFYYSTANSTSLYADKVVIYDYHRDQWTHAALEASFVFPSITLGVTLDGLDTAFPTYNMDTLPFSLDARHLQGTLPSLGAFGSDRKLSFFTSSNLEATIRTAESELLPDRRTLVVNSRALVDTAAATVALGHRERLADPVTTDAAVSQEDTGECPQGADGRYHQATLSVAAGQSWTKAHGIAFDAVDSGEI